MKSLELTLMYKDGSSWFAGGFSSQESLDAWVAEERTRSYWDKETQISVVDKTPIEEN